MNTREALDRTILLMRDEVEASISDETILAALVGTRVALIADAANLATHSAQSAYVTAALLMARSAHTVHLLAPDLPLVGAQIPLMTGSIISALLEAGSDLLPGVAFTASMPDAPVDLAVAFGDSPVGIVAHRCICLNATDWSGLIEREESATQWQGGEWPIGGLAAATLASGEAFKCTMQKLSFCARNPARIETVFAPTDEIIFRLAPEGTPKNGALGAFDCISGGAIVHAALYTLGRIPGLNGYGRVIEPDTADLSNLNRYALLRRSTSLLPKAEHLAKLFAPTGLTIDALPLRYDEGMRHTLHLAPAVIVGVDDIPTRWQVQRANPDWLTVGATTHWCAMASFHEAGLGCAECAHPYDDPGDGRIPTVAFVSFWAGLLAAAYFLRHVSGERTSVKEQQTFLTAFRVENAVRSIVPLRPGCPSCSSTYAAIQR